MALLTTSNLSKAYGPEDIFDGVSLSIPHRARIGPGRAKRDRQDNPAAHPGGRRIAIRRASQPGAQFNHRLPAPGSPPAF